MAAERSEIATPRYKRDDTYSGTTQDVIRLIHEAEQRGVARVEIRHKDWHVIVEWPEHSGRTEATDG
jgi:hypothetical protein